MIRLNILWTTSDWYSFTYITGYRICHWLILVNIISVFCQLLDHNYTVIVFIKRRLGIIEQLIDLSFILFFFISFQSYNTSVKTRFWVWVKFKAKYWIFQSCKLGGVTGITVWMQLILNICSWRLTTWVTIRFPMIIDCTLVNYNLLIDRLQ